MKRCAILLIIVSLLTGCVAVVVGAAAGLAVYDRRSVITMEKDARIFHVIHKSIVSDPQFQDSRILISSFNRVVLLLGQTPTPGVKASAERIARDTGNVTRVYNEITNGYPIPLTQRTTDSWITSQARSFMLTRQGLESGSIHVVTENGIVYLMGIVTREQADLAVNVARQIEGVQKVVKVFQYIV